MLSDYHSSHTDSAADAPMPPGFVQETMFENTRMVRCRCGHPLAGARTWRDLADAERATTSITVSAEVEFRRLT
jgi:hypothetical protein